MTSLEVPDLSPPQPLPVGLASDLLPLCAADYQPNGAQPLAPSAIAIKGEIPTPSGMKPYPEPQALTKQGIQELVNDYRQAARNSIDAGEDAPAKLRFQGWCGENQRHLEHRSKCLLMVP